MSPQFVFKPNKWAFLVAILLMVIALIAFKKRKKVIQVINHIKDTAMSTLYRHLLDPNGKFILDRSKPRGERNNNPGNLIQTTINWKGKVESERNSDGRFEQFYEIKYGIRALIKDLLNDINKKGKNTISALIAEFAPAHENNTNAYMLAVAKRMGIGINTPFSASKTNLEQLVKAIAEHENGKQIIHDLDFEEAWKLV